MAVSRPGRPHWFARDGRSGVQALVAKGVVSAAKIQKICSHPGLLALAQSAVERRFQVPPAEAQALVGRLAPNSDKNVERFALLYGVLQAIAQAQHGKPSLHPMIGLAISGRPLDWTRSERLVALLLHGHWVEPGDVKSRLKVALDQPSSPTAEATSRFVRDLNSGLRGQDGLNAESVLRVAVTKEILQPLLEAVWSSSPLGQRQRVYQTICAVLARQVRDEATGDAGISESVDGLPQVLARLVGGSKNPAVRAYSALALATVTKSGTFVLHDRTLPFWRATLDGMSSDDPMLIADVADVVGTLREPVEFRSELDGWLKRTGLASRIEDEFLTAVRCFALDAGPVRSMADAPGANRTAIEGLEAENAVLRHLGARLLVSLAEVARLSVDLDSSVVPKLVLGLAPLLELADDSLRWVVAGILEGVVSYPGSKPGLQALQENSWAALFVALERSLWSSSAAESPFAEYQTVRILEVMKHCFPRMSAQNVDSIVRDLVTRASEHASVSTSDALDTRRQGIGVRLLCLLRGVAHDWALKQDAHAAVTQIAKGQLRDADSDVATVSACAWLWDLGVEAQMPEGPSEDEAMRRRIDAYLEAQHEHPFELRVDRCADLLAYVASRIRPGVTLDWTTVTRMAIRALASKDGQGIQFDQHLCVSVMGLGMASSRGAANVGLGDTSTVAREAEVLVALVPLLARLRPENTDAQRQEIYAALEHIALSTCPEVVASALFAFFECLSKDSPLSSEVSLAIQRTGETRAGNRDLQRVWRLCAERDGFARESRKAMG
jgi:hypothetical protein